MLGLVLEFNVIAFVDKPIRIENFVVDPITIDNIVLFSFTLI